MAEFRQNTAFTHQFLMILSSDHLTGYNGAANTITVTLGKNGANGVAAVGAVSQITSMPGNGVYAIALSAASDLNVAGSLSLSATAATCDTTNEFHQVRPLLVNTDLQLDPSNFVKISSVVKQNTTFLFPFIMTVNGVATPGLTGFVAQRNLGAGFAPCVNSVVEDGVGWYHLLLAPSDTNNPYIELHITATSADALNTTLYTQP